MAKERRRYRKTLTRMWADEKFRSLSRPKPNGQTLWQFVITGPHTTSVPGLFTAGEQGLAESLGWSLRGFRLAWLEIETLKMAEADWTARVVWVPKAIRHNAPENPNVVKSWRHAIDDIPECALKSKALKQIDGYLKGLGEGFQKAFRSTLTQPLANQDQEQEQEQEQDQEDQRGNQEQPAQLIDPDVWKDAVDKHTSATPKRIRGVFR